MTEEENNRKALSAMEDKELEEAEKYIAKTIERTPYLINRSIIYKELYKKTNNVSYLNQAEECLNKAALKNPHDVMISYYQASVLREKGNSKAALHILTELTQKFPNKSLFQLATFDILYQTGQHANALPHLKQAVKLSPNLLDNPYLKDVLSKDSTLNESLKNSLLQDVSIEKNAIEPVFLAKSGKILLSLGLENEAKQCLEKSILLLPNLIYPYYYLSKIETRQNNPEQGMIYLKQFVFLYSGALSKEVIDKTIHSGEIEKLFMNKKDFTDNSYTAKFQTWYHSSTTIKQLFP
jgi:tetratricopeptide (TPR) repeat protein